FPEPVKTPVSNFDYVWSLHLIFRESSRKYFNFRPYFMGILATPVENSVEKIVDFLWTKCGSFHTGRMNGMAVCGNKKVL
ncbi:MAG: hypothetical protein ABL984_20150, partial [Pyrinomonadaceae bacterium]